MMADLLLNDTGLQRSETIDGREGSPGRVGTHFFLLVVTLLEVPVQFPAIFATSAKATTAAVLAQITPQFSFPTISHVYHI